MIELKNIDLTGVKMQEQLEKVVEEDREFIQALVKGTDEELIEELCDKFQAAIGLVERVRGITVKDIEKYWPTHLEKLKNRPR